MGKRKAINTIEYSDYLTQRTIEEAIYYVESATSIRDVAKKFGVCKTTVHHDFRFRLRDIDFDLYCEVEQLLELNKDTTVEKMNAANKAANWSQNKNKRRNSK